MEENRVSTPRKEALRMRAMAEEEARRE